MKKLILLNLSKIYINYNNINIKIIKTLKNRLCLNTEEMKNVYVNKKDGSTQKLMEILKNS